MISHCIQKGDIKERSCGGEEVYEITFVGSAEDTLVLITEDKGYISIDSYFVNLILPADNKDFSDRNFFFPTRLLNKIVKFYRNKATDPDGFSTNIPDEFYGNVPAEEWVFKPASTVVCPSRTENAFVMEKSGNEDHPRIFR